MGEIWSEQWKREPTLKAYHDTNISPKGHLPGTGEKDNNHKI